MKSRRVVVTIEMDTCATMAELRDKRLWQEYAGLELPATMVRQVQVNVVQAAKGKK